MARECRLETEDTDPISVAEFGPKTKKPIYRQIIEARDPKESSNGTWNLHFILGKSGILVQCCVFGSKEEIFNFSKKIHVDEYFVFWGYTVKANNYITNLTSTSDYGILIPSNSTKFERVSVTKVYQKPDLDYSEEHEVLSNSFRQAGPSRVPPKRVRKKEQTFKEKTLLVDPSQKKITDFTFDPQKLELHYSSDSLLSS